ncbi:HAMP domain-containing histidine kinase [Pseudodesulfovibrio sp.]|nr:HAMP domain-containing histidine kinase [Pseudodesulfovibrio sp.]
MENKQRTSCPDNGVGSTRPRSSLEHSFNICFSSKRSRTLCVTFLFAVLLALALPLANITITYPAFTNIIVEGIEEDARRLAIHSLPPSLKHSELTSQSMTERFFGDIYKLENIFGLLKVKIFSAAGEVLYSTEPADIGVLNTQPYFKDVVAKGSSYTKLVTKDMDSLEGQKVRVDVVETYVPFMNGSRFLGAFEMYYDITKRIQALDRLVLYSEIAMGILSASLILAVLILLKKEVAHQQAEYQAETLRGDVDRITRHDMKAPVISLLNGITLLEQFTSLTEEQHETTNDMRKAANTAMNMINRSLDLYKMETGVYQYTPLDMDLLVITRQAANDLAGLASTHSVTLLLLKNGSVPGEDDTFPMKAEEILCYSLIANLLKNGIEASDTDGTVTVALSGNGNIRLSVHNSGAVPEEIRDTFFEKYATAGKSTGTGIGTYSAKLMTETMGGTIEMTTSEENGTKVVITLPTIQTTTEE